MAGISAWRVNDVVAYDRMRESAMMLGALLLGLPASEPSTSDNSHAEVARVHRDVLAVDGYDRAAVAALATRISDRIRELAQDSS